MKLHISQEQLTELSQKGKEKLRAWWKPELEHIVSEKNYKQGVPLYVLVDNVLRSGWSFDQAMEDVIALPLLSIGQMIELLDEHKSLVNNEEYLPFKEITWSVGEELADALWDAVKQVLEK